MSSRNEPSVDPETATAASHSQSQQQNNTNNTNNTIIPADETARITRDDPSSQRRRRRLIRPRSSSSLQFAAIKQVKKLHAASDELLCRLFSHLSQLPEEDTQEDDFIMSLNKQQQQSQQQESVSGITLPASAVGWLATQLYPNDEDIKGVRAMTTMTNSSSSFPSSSPPLAVHSNQSLTGSLQDRMALLKFLLPRLTHVRIINSDWPQQFTRQQQQQQQQERQYHQHDHHHNNNNEHNDDDSTVATVFNYIAGILHRPRVDMRLFPNCNVLLVDQVPSKWITHLQVLRKTLQVLRVERSCIHNLPQLLHHHHHHHHPQEQSPTNSSSSVHDDNDELDATFRFSKLTHIKLSLCNLNDTALTAPRQQQQQQQQQPSEQLQRVFSRMMHLTSVCLSHNELSSLRCLVRAGLVHKPFLTHLDVSYNYLRRMIKYTRLFSNLTHLNLSHNQITSTKHMEQLVSLQSLQLDHNQITDVAQLTPLTRLPDLMQLSLKGNPLERARPQGMRVDVLNMFREQRMHRLPPNATFRQVQAILPVLDGKLASIGELKAIRDRTYRRLETAIVFANAEENWVSVQQQQEQQSTTTMNTEEAGSGVSRLQRKRRQRRRKASISEKVDSQTDTVIFVEHQVDPDFQPLVAFKVDDVMLSLSVQDSLLWKEPDNEQTDAESLEAQDEGDRRLSQPFAYLIDGLIEGEHAIIKSPDLFERLSDSYKNVYVATNGGLETKGLTQAVDESLPLAPDNNDDEQLKSAFDLALLSPIHKNAHDRDDGPELKESATTAATTVDADMEPLLNNEASPFKASETGQEVEETPSRTPSLMHLESDHSGSQPSSSFSPFRLNFHQVASYGGLLVQDESLSVGGLASPQPSQPGGGQSSKKLFLLAEEHASYRGPKLYEQVNVLDNLDLYFRSFVFDMSRHDLPADTTDDEEEWLSILGEYPKIQVWPVDRRYREAVKEKAVLAGKITPKEEIRKVWQEKVIACGQPALRRLTPNRGARYGFHGELLWSAASTTHLTPEIIAENRQVIICLTDMSLYIVLDHDSVTEKTKDQSRTFPLPIPRGATFCHAKWPHALAYHPLQTLKSISIGFGFQRLTLRFANTTFPVPDDFCYVLLTSNKTETIALLKELQTLSNEAKSAAALAMSEAALVIENDDRHVLDALGTAVSPDGIGTILHYQILFQRWKSGDRGMARRVCVLTETKLFLLDEDYVGDGSESVDATRPNSCLGDTMYRLVDSSDLQHVTMIQAADADPSAITIAIRPLNRLQRTHNWRLVCRNGIGAERLVEDIRKAIALL